jgi:transcriptional regulator with XRE-family HTH domain
MEKIFRILIRQVKAARELIGWKQTDLADACGLSIVTIRRLESREGKLGGRADTAAKIIAALESAGVIFINENGEGPGLRLKENRDGRCGRVHPARRLERRERRVARKTGNSLGSQVLDE